MDEHKFILLESSVVPDVFIKVLEAKRLLAEGEAKSATQAAKTAGISRSAFYKYKDSVFSYGKGSGGSILTVSATLKDRAGVLSGLLLEFYKAGANILTVNQNIPTGGAPVPTAERVKLMVPPPAITLFRAASPALVNTNSVMVLSSRRYGFIF